MGRGGKGKGKHGKTNNSNWAQTEWIPHPRTHSPRGHSPANCSESGEEREEYQLPLFQFEESLIGRARRICTQYEETRVPELLDDLRAISEEFEVGGEIPDPVSLGLIMGLFCRAKYIAECTRLCIICEEAGVRMDVSTAAAVIVQISQRTQEVAAIEFITALSSLLDNGPEEREFFCRHVSYAVAELLSEGHETCNRADNWPPAALIAAGSMEDGLLINPRKPATQMTCMLYNHTLPGTETLVYNPSIQPPPFSKIDTALMRLTSTPGGQDYNPIRDSAEVEIISATVNSPISIRFLTSPPRFYDEMRDASWRLDKLGNRDQMRRIVDAAKVMLLPESRGGAAKRPSAKPNPHVMALLTTRKGRQVSEDDWAEEICTLDQRKNIYEEVTRLRSMDRLNESQGNALIHASCARLTLIQGPPGTGKTTTAVQIIVAMINNDMCGGGPMLVAADSNTAVDNLVLGVAKEGIKVKRCGRLESMREEVKKYSLDGHWSDLKKAQVICATCIGSGGDALDKMRFHTVVIDECTQASESSTLVPISRGCQQLILIGDQCQLPPTVLSPYAQRESLGDSLFHRFVQQGVSPSLLDTQYRMHPYICEFASASFYNSRLRTGISHVQRPPLEGFPWPVRSIPVCFIPLDKSVEVKEGTSYTNTAEAEKVIWVLQQIGVGDALPVDQAGVVTPYIGQVNVIKKLIRERPSCANFKNIEVSSVDGFQGREKDAIIFSAVRANKLGKVGFLDDWRRLNVMITRAKRGMIVIGNRTTLSYDFLWGHWLNWAQARGAVMGESARGKWTPKYLVDGAYGMIEEDEAPAAVPDSPELKPTLDDGPKEPVWEAVDSWEDIEV